MRHYMNVRVVMEGCENSDEAEKWQQDAAPLFERVLLLK